MYVHLLRTQRGMPVHIATVIVPYALDGRRDVGIVSVHVRTAGQATTIRFAGIPVRVVH